MASFLQNNYKKDCFENSFAQNHRRMLSDPPPLDFKSKALDLPKINNQVAAQDKVSNDIESIIKINNTARLPKRSQEVHKVHHHDVSAIFRQEQNQHFKILKNEANGTNHKNLVNSNSSCCSSIFHFSGKKSANSTHTNIKQIKFKSVDINNRVNKLLQDDIDSSKLLNEVEGVDGAIKFNTIKLLKLKKRDSKLTDANLAFSKSLLSSSKFQINPKLIKSELLRDNDWLFSIYQENMKQMLKAPQIRHLKVKIDTLND